MTKQKKKELKERLDQLNEIQAFVEQTKDEEQEKFDNLSEGLQESERGQQLEEYAELLECAGEALAEAIENICEIV